MYGDTNMSMICRSSSENGLTWTVAGSSLVGKGGEGKFDQAYLWLPRVWIEDGTWNMLYTGKASSGVTSIGWATSPDGTTWTKQNSGDAIFSGGAHGTWDHEDVELSSIIKIGSTYYLWYNSLDVGPRKIGLATATDLAGPWTADVNNPIFDDGSDAVFCGDFFKVGSVYFALVVGDGVGGDYHKFKLYRDTDPTFYPDHRTFVSIYKECGPGDWDGLDEDVPWIVTDDITRSTYTIPGDNRGHIYFSGASATGGAWSSGLIIADLSTFV